MRKILIFFYRKVEAFLPAKLQLLIWDYYLSNLVKSSYSQYGEDLIINNFFDGKDLNNGNYLDIGCYHPTGISNTHALHLKGWKGLVVDIDDYKLSLFKKRRGSKVETLKAAISYKSSQELVSVYKFNQPFSPYDTLSKEVADMRSKEINIGYSVEKVQQIDINLLLAKQEYDLINIDVEGLDEIIVNSINFQKYQPSLIVYESFEPYEPSDTKKVLLKNGYELLFITGGSLGFHKRVNKNR